MVEGTRLENEQRLETVRGFESHPLRHHMQSEPTLEVGFLFCIWTMNSMLCHESLFS